MTTPSVPIRRSALHAALPLDREPYLMLAQAVLAWSGPHEVLQRRDYEQIAWQLADHARAVADDVRHCCTALPKNSAIRALTEIVLGEAERRLSVPPRPTVTGVQNLARLLRALYERHGRIHNASQLSRAALSS